MSVLSWFVLILGGVVATIAAVAITFVIASTLAQASVLVYKWLVGSRQVHGEGAPLAS